MGDKTRAEELYDDFKKGVEDDIRSGTENFDKNLLAFSSGALGVSLAFIKDIVPLGQAHLVPCLVISWIAFALCVLVTMASFQVSIKALECSLPFAEKYYFKNERDAFDKHRGTFWCRAVDWCTCTAGILFVVGLVCTIIFVCVNVGVKKHMSKDEDTQKIVTSDLGKAAKPGRMTPLEEGYRPQPMTPTRDVGAGVKPGPMTPAPEQGGSQPAPGNTPAPKKE